MKYAMVAAGIAASALAQILAKQASGQPSLSLRWFLFIGSAAGCYGAAFLLYVYILRQFPISRISPAMTVAVAAIVVIFGIAIGEKLSPVHWWGLGLCLIGFILLAR